jgi:hypothetical protein
MYAYDAIICVWYYLEVAPLWIKYIQKLYCWKRIIVHNYVHESSLSLRANYEACSSHLIRAIKDLQ